MEDSSARKSPVGGQRVLVPCQRTGCSFEAVEYVENSFYRIHIWSPIMIIGWFRATPRPRPTPSGQVHHNHIQWLYLLPNPLRLASAQADHRYVK